MINRAYLEKIGEKPKKKGIIYADDESNKSVRITSQGILLGKSVSSYFRKKNVRSVIVILDFKNSLILIKANDQEYNESLLSHTYEILYGKTKAIDAQTINREFSLIRIPCVLKCMLVNKKFFRAKPLGSDTILIENIKFKSVNSFPTRAYINLDERYVIIGHFFGETLPKPENWRRQTNVQSQPPSPNANNIITTAQNISKVAEIPLVKSPEISQKNDLRLISDRMPYEEPEVSPEEQELMDNRYKKMILGE